MRQSEIYDVTFKCPFNCIMSGSSGSGKTTRLFEFLKLKDVMCNAKFYKVYYITILYRVYFIKYIISIQHGKTSMMK